MKVSLSPDIILCGWLGWKYQLTNSLYPSLPSSPTLHHIPASQMRHKSLGSLVWRTVSTWQNKMREAERIQKRWNKQSKSKQRLYSLRSESCRPISNGFIVQTWMLFCRNSSRFLDGGHGVLPSGEVTQGDKGTHQSYLMRSLVTSIFLYARESWTLTTELQRRMQSHGNEVLPPDTTHFIQKPYYQRGSPCQDPADRKETQTAVIWSCLPFIRSGQNHLARHGERGKKTRQTEEEVGRHQGMMDRQWSSAGPRGQWRTGKNGENWLRNHLWCPDDPRG